MVAPITAAMLYELVACPHRVTMDLFADPAQRDEPNPFVELLWEKGSPYEREVIAGLQVPFLDLSPYAGDEKERLTLEAMQKGRGPYLWRTHSGRWIIGRPRSALEPPRSRPAPKLFQTGQPPGHWPCTSGTPGRRDTAEPAVSGPANRLAGTAAHVEWSLVASVTRLELPRCAVVSHFLV